MKTTRTTATAATVTVTEDQMRSSLAQYVEHHCAIDCIEAETKAAIEQLKKAAEEKARSHKEQRDTHESLVKTWAIQNPDRFTKPRKIEIFGGHKVGFDLGQPAVSLIKPTAGKGRQTWDGFLAACKAIRGKFAEIAQGFVRTVEEPAKDVILAYHRDNDDAAAQLATLGIEVKQTERFVIDLNLQPDAVASRA